MEIVVGFEKLIVEEAIYANGGEAITDIVGGVLGVSSGLSLWYAASEISGTTIAAAAGIVGLGTTGVVCIAAGVCLAGYGIYH